MALRDDNNLAPMGKLAWCIAVLVCLNGLTWSPVAGCDGSRSSTSEDKVFAATRSRTVVKPATPSPLKSKFRFMGPSAEEQRPSRIQSGPPETITGTPGCK